MLIIAFTALVFPQKMEALNNAQGVPCPGTPTVTYFGKTYNTVLIGSQCWLKENLDVGTMIDSLQNQTNNGIIEKYCYNNNPNNCNTYGGLYQWNEAMLYSTTEGAQGICPNGWHIPTYLEFQMLVTFVDSNGNALKAVGQGSGNGEGTNTSGFSGLLAGYRHYHREFYGINYYTMFWGSTWDGLYASQMYLVYLNNDIYLNFDVISYGISVRCVKDNANGVNYKDKLELPKKYMLLQNNPNPFNSQTEISFSVPKESYITLKIYDLLGREVATLAQEMKQPGEYSVTWSAEGLTSGVYYYRLVAIDPSLRSGQVFIQTKKMILMK